MLRALRATFLMIMACYHMRADGVVTFKGNHLAIPGPCIRVSPCQSNSALDDMWMPWEPTYELRDPQLLKVVLIGWVYGKREPLQGVVKSISTAHRPSCYAHVKCSQ